MAQEVYVGALEDHGAQQSGLTAVEEATSRALNAIDKNGGGASDSLPHWEG